MPENKANSNQTSCISLQLPILLRFFSRLVNQYPRSKVFFRDKSDGQEKNNFVSYLGEIPSRNLLSLYI